jgi:hypothetical protein
MSHGIIGFIFAAFAWVFIGIFIAVALSEDPTQLYPYTNYLPMPTVFFVIPILFGLLFSIPLFKWVVECFTIRKSWEDTHYVITNRRVIIQSAGIVRREIKASFIRELSGAFLKIDWMDRIYHTGTVRLMFNNLNFVQTHGDHDSRSAALNEIRHIDDVETVFAKVQKLVTEAQQ